MIAFVAELREQLATDLTDYEKSRREMWEQAKRDAITIAELRAEKLAERGVYCTTGEYDD
jgi:hypothetical protein